MKTLKILITLCLVAATLITRADAPSKATTKYATDLLINAFMNGQYAEFEKLLDNGAKMTVKTKSSIQSYDKKQIIAYTRQDQNIRQNCSVTANVVESAPGEAIVRVIMDYENFSRVNVVSLSLLKGEWKITHISSSFN